MRRPLFASLAATVFGVVLVHPAAAADLPPAPAYKAPAVVPAGFNWTGFYLGAYGGYAFGSGNTDRFGGGMAGGTIGYNWQPIGSQFVFGIEGDGGWTNFGDSVSVVVAPVVVTASSEASATATIRARFGAAFDRTLLYVTGGGAWARNKISISAAVGGVAAGISDTQNHFGYAAGAGIEYAFTNNWSVKAEYLYLGLGSENYFTNVLGVGVASGSLNMHTAKLGLNYRF